MVTSSSLFVPVAAEAPPIPCGEPSPSLAGGGRVIPPPVCVPPGEQVSCFARFPALVNAQCASSPERSILSESFRGKLEVSFRSTAKRLRSDDLEGHVIDKTDDNQGC